MYIARGATRKTGARIWTQGTSARNRVQGASVFRMSLFALALGDLLASVVAAGANMVAQMDFSCGRLNGQRWRRQEIMRTMHTALGRGFFVLLDSHIVAPKNSYK